MKPLGTVNKANKAGAVWGGGGIRDSIFAVRCSLLYFILMYKNAEGYIMRAVKVLVIESKIIWFNQEIHFYKLGSTLVCSFMLIPGKEIIFPYFLRISLLLFYCLRAVEFHLAFSVWFPSTFCLSSVPTADVSSWKYSF